LIITNREDENVIGVIEW